MTAAVTAPHGSPGNNQTAFIAFPYAPGGVVMDTYLARVPLNILQ